MRRALETPLLGGVQHLRDTPNLIWSDPARRSRSRLSCQGSGSGHGVRRVSVQTHEVSRCVGGAAGDVAFG